MTFRTFEEIEAWQLSRKLTREIYEATAKNNFARDFRLVSQVCDASASIMSNIAEGSERGSDREFIQFLRIAKASAAEVRSRLYVALDQNYIDRADFDRLAGASRVISSKIGSLIAYLRGCIKKGKGEQRPRRSRDENEDHTST